MTQRRAVPLLAAPVAMGLLALAVIALGPRQGGAAVHAYEVGAAALCAAVAGALAIAARPSWTLSVGLGLTVFSSHWHEIGIPLPFDRLMVGCGILSLLARERLVDRDALRTRPIDWLLAVVALYAVCSSILAGTIGQSLARYALLDRFSLIGFVLFFVAPKAFRQERDRALLLRTLVIVGFYLGVTAFMEKAGLRSLVLPRYIADPSVGIHFGRARGPFTEAAANGLALFGCGVAAAMAAARWRDRRARRFAAAVVLLCGLGLLLTETRAVWIAAGAGALVALASSRRTRRYAIPALAAAAVAVVVVLAAFPSLRASVTERTNDQQPLWDRKNSNAAALRMIDAKPLFGFGWGRFASDSPDYYRQAFDYPLTGVRNVHNVYLANAVELGLLGGGLWLLACLVAIGGAILRRGPPPLRDWRIGLIAVAVSYAVVGMTTPLGYPFSALLMWTWAGLVWGERRPFSVGK
jgi:putative inorganic carbon (HCO3(-)) transporter